MIAEEVWPISELTAGFRLLAGGEVLGRPLPCWRAYTGCSSRPHRASSRITRAVGHAASSCAAVSVKGRASLFAGSESPDVGPLDPGRCALEPSLLF